MWQAAVPLIPGGEEGTVGKRPGGPQPGPSVPGTAVSTSLDVDGQTVAPQSGQAPAPSLTGCGTLRESCPRSLLRLPDLSEQPGQNPSARLC